MNRKTIKIAKKFDKRIKVAIDAERIIIFGSGARGDNFNRSDFDFINSE